MSMRNEFLKLVQDNIEEFTSEQIEAATAALKAQPEEKPKEKLKISFGNVTVNTPQAEALSEALARISGSAMNATANTTTTLRSFVYGA